MWSIFRVDRAEAEGGRILTWWWVCYKSYYFEYNKLYRSMGLFLYCFYDFYVIIRRTKPKIFIVQHILKYKEREREREREREKFSR